MIIYIVYIFIYLRLIIYDIEMCIDKEQKSVVYISKIIYLFMNVLLYKHINIYSYINKTIINDTQFMSIS